MWYVVILVLFFIVTTSLIDSAFEVKRDLKELEQEKDLFENEEKGGKYDEWYY